MSKFLFCCSLPPIRIIVEAIKGQRQISEIATEFDVHPNLITKWKKQFFDNGASVFSKKQDTRVESMEEKEEDLFNKIGKQQIELDFLRKKLKKTGVQEKRQMVETGNSKLSIKNQCSILDISRSGYYYKPAPISEYNLFLMKQIDEIFTESPEYGSRKTRDIKKEPIEARK